MEKSKQIYFIGPSNSGKTTTIEKLIETNSNMDIGTVKFIHKDHSFQIDPDSKDTRRHRNAGSSFTLCFSPNETIVLIPEASRASMSDFEKYTQILPKVDHLFIESLNNPPEGSNVILFTSTAEEFQSYYAKVEGSNILGICSKDGTIDHVKNIKFFDMDEGNFIKQLSDHLF